MKSTNPVQKSPNTKGVYKSIQKQLNKNSNYESIFYRRSISQTKNPEQQATEIKMLVKQYLMDKNIQDLKSKFYTERLLKKRNRVSIDMGKSKEFKKDQTHKPSNNHVEMSRYLKHSDILDNHHTECQKCKQCTCKSHHCDTNKIKFKIKDPLCKYQSNYTRDNIETKAKSNLHIQRPQISASYFSNQLENLPQYSPKFQTLNGESSYNCQYSPFKAQDKVESFKHLKLSNVKFGLKQVKNFESSYEQQFNFEEDKKKASKTPQPFVVKQCENLNSLGLRYNSINSNYSKQFVQKNNGRRTPLKRPQLFKDVNIRLIKDSKYMDVYSPRQDEIRTSRKQRIKKQKIPVVHHLSSSFLPLDGISDLFNSSYKKDYLKRQDKNDVHKYSCPHGLKSSNGTVARFN